ncbi:unnamed protein product [Staurois parvus]|uniref:Secreted protein n=1 Tax=Staurois parvus TaxID=386267 RepID=A0ABN9E5F7_9NEOB|nr:unnamed protein product [Staurois parvus]
MSFEKVRGLMPPIMGLAHHLSVSISALCQCSPVPRASAHQCHINVTYQCLPVHINATYQCPSELPFCHPSVPVSAT